MADTLLSIGNTIVQHGSANDRVYLMKLDEADAENALQQVEELADRESYSKIFAKVPASSRPLFVEQGYEQEAHIPNYYRGKSDLHFMSRFLEDTRRNAAETDEQRQVLDLALSKACDDGADSRELPSGCICRVCVQADIPDIVRVYRRVFESYPFPIHDPAFIADTMATHVTYFGVWQDEELVALSSAERDIAADSVEMTDFATLPSARGNGLGVSLLQRMEQEMRRRSVETAYTIARAVSAGMNIVFAKQGYNYGGTLINNTDICGHLESMNIWWKPLRLG